MQPNQEIFKNYYGNKLDEVKREALLRQEVTTILNELNDVQGQEQIGTNDDSAIFEALRRDGEFNYDDLMSFSGTIGSHCYTKKLLKPHDTFAGDDGITVQTRFSQYIEKEDRILTSRKLTGIQVFMLEIGATTNENQEMTQGQGGIVIARDPRNDALHFFAVTANPNLGQLRVREAIRDDLGIDRMQQGHVDDSKYKLIALDGVQAMEVVDELRKALHVNRPQFDPLQLPQLEQ